MLSVMTFGLQATYSSFSASSRYQLPYRIPFDGGETTTNLSDHRPSLCNCLDWYLLAHLDVSSGLLESSDPGGPGDVSRSVEYLGPYLPHPIVVCAVLK